MGINSLMHQTTSRPSNFVIKLSTCLLNSKHKIYLAFKIHGLWTSITSLTNIVEYVSNKILPRFIQKQQTHNVSTQNHPPKLQHTPASSNTYALHFHISRPPPPPSPSPKWGNKYQIFAYLLSVVWCLSPSISLLSCLFLRR